MSLSILSIRSSIAFASCTSWTNFKDDLSTRKGKVVQSLGREHYFLKEGGWGGGVGGLVIFGDVTFFLQLKVVYVLV